MATTKNPYSTTNMVNTATGQNIYGVTPTQADVNVANQTNPAKTSTASGSNKVTTPVAQNNSGTRTNTVTGYNSYGNQGDPAGNAAYGGTQNSTNNDQIAALKQAYLDKAKGTGTGSGSGGTATEPTTTVEASYYSGGGSGGGGGGYEEEGSGYDIEGVRNGFNNFIKFLDTQTTSNANRLLSALNAENQINEDNYGLTKGLLDNGYAVSQNTITDNYDALAKLLGDNYEAETSLADDNYNRMMKLYENNRQSAEDRLKAQHESDLNELNTTSDNALQQAYINRMLSQKGLNQALASQGINGGAAESSLVNLFNNYGNARNNIETTRQNNLGKLQLALDNNLANILDAYNTGTTTAGNQRGTDLMNALKGKNSGLASALTDKNGSTLDLVNNYTGNSISNANNFANNRIAANQNYQNGLTANAQSYNDAITNAFISALGYDPEILAGLRYDLNAEELNKLGIANDVGTAATTQNDVNANPLAALLKAQTDAKMKAAKK